MPNNDLTNLAPVNYQYSQDLTSEQKIRVKENIGVAYGNILPESGDEGDIFLLDTNDSTALSNIGAVSYKYSQTLSDINKEIVTNNIKEIVNITDNISVTATSANIQVESYTAYKNNFGLVVSITARVIEDVAVSSTATMLLTLPSEYNILVRETCTTYSYDTIICCRLTTDGVITCRMMGNTMQNNRTFVTTFHILG